MRESEWLDKVHEAVQGVGDDAVDRDEIVPSALARCCKSEGVRKHRAAKAQRRKDALAYRLRWCVCWLFGGARGTRRIRSNTARAWRSAA